jgi:hypothetical protein
MNFQFQKKAKARAIEEITNEEIQKEMKSPLWKGLLKSVAITSIPVSLAGLIGGLNGNESALQNIQALLPLYPLSSILPIAWNIMKRNSVIVDAVKKERIKSIKKTTEGKDLDFKDMGLTALFGGVGYLAISYLSNKIGITPDFSAKVIFSTGAIYGTASYLYNSFRKINIAETVKERARKLEEEIQEEYYHEQEQEYKRRMQEFDALFEEFFKSFAKGAYNRANNQGNRDTRNNTHSGYESRPRVIRTEITYTQAVSIMGLNQNVTYAEARKKYHELAMKYHPHRNPGNKGAEEQFKKIADAWKVVSTCLNPNSKS